ncbi:MAG: hypothetical protein WC917_04630, partial [Bacilli bacterium]
MSKETDGLFKKYQVFKDGVEVEDKTFILNLDTDVAARRVALSYATFIGNKKLYDDLKNFYKLNNYKYSYVDV